MVGQSGTDFRNVRQQTLTVVRRADAVDID
jgi:hypothetical protein